MCIRQFHLFCLTFQCVIVSDVPNLSANASTFIFIAEYADAYFPVNEWEIQ